MKNERMTRRSLLQLLLYSILIFFSSCSGNDDDDNDSTAPGLDNLLSSEYQDEIIKYVPLNKGSSPPNVEGTYYMNTPVITFDSDDDKELGTDYAIISIKNQSTVNTVSFEMRECDNDEEGEEELTKSDLCQISGSGSKFTLCFKYYEVDGNANVTVVFVISGTKTTSGIADFCGGFIVTERNDPDGDSDFAYVGYIILFAEKDGLASNYSSTAASAKAINMIRERNSFFKRPLMK